MNYYFAAVGDAVLITKKATESKILFRIDALENMRFILFGVV